MADPLFASRSALLHFDGANASKVFTDQKGGTFTGFGDAQLSTAQAKWGASSLRLDGTGDYLRRAYTSALFEWWTSGVDSAFEMWVYPLAFPAAACLCGNMESNSNTNYFSFGPFTGGQLQFYYYNGTTNAVTSTLTIPLNAWSHVVVQKTSAGIQIGANGVLESPVAVSGTPQASTGTAFTIGQVNSICFNGYIDDFRATRGVGAAPYSGSSYTVPTGPFPDSAVESVSANQTAAAATQAAALANVGRATAVQSAAATTQLATIAQIAKLSSTQTAAANTQVATVTNLAGASLQATQTAQATSQAATISVRASAAAAQTAGATSQAALLSESAQATAAQTADDTSQTASISHLSAATADQVAEATTQTAELIARVQASAAQLAEETTQVVELLLAGMGVRANQTAARTTQSARLGHAFSFERNERTLLVAAERRGFVVVGEVRTAAAVRELRNVALAGERRRIAFTD